MQIHYVSVAQTFGLNQSYSHNQHVFGIADTLVFTNNDQQYRNQEQLIQSLLFSQNGRYTLSGSKSLNQTLGFNQSAYRVRVSQLYQNFSYIENYSGSKKWPLVNGVLSYQELINIIPTKGAYDTLNFGHLATPSFNRSLVLNDLFVPTQYLAIYKLDRGSAFYEPTVNNYVTFAIGGTSIQLRTPDFGNVDSVEMRRIQRETLGGKLNIYRDPNWSMSESFQLTFSYIAPDLVRQVQQFINLSLGQLVIFTDHEGNSWSGLINSPDFEISTPGRSNKTFKIKFEVIFT